jgi:SAM-dependent methyltransferase
MDLRSLLLGRILWRAAEKIERKSHVWFNRAVRISGSWRKASIVEINERIVEGPFVLGRIEGNRILDVGSSESLLPLELASLGFNVVALDVREYPVSHPGMTVSKEDIRGTSFPADSLDTVIALSTIEHIGLGFYGDPMGPDGDRQAITEIHRILKPGGRFLLTVPFGKAATAEGHRVYDSARLRGLLTEFEIEEFLCCIRDHSTCWRRAEIPEAEMVDSTAFAQSVALLSLRKRPPAEGGFINRDL